MNVENGVRDEITHVLGDAPRPMNAQSMTAVVLTDSYIDGLSSAGTSIHPDLVRLGMTATMAAKYAWIAPAMARAVVEGRDKLNGRPTAEAVATWAPAVQYLLDRADEARRLT